MREELDEIWRLLKKHHYRLKNLSWRNIMKKIAADKLLFEKWKNNYPGLHLALCVDTRDPWKQNRIKFFSPVLNLQPDLSNTQNYTQIGQLNWAWPVSAMGGIDDSGLTWVPPPGSTVCILFQNGNLNTAFYIGTTWQRDKGPENSPNWGYDIPEYRKIFQGHRKGNMVGKNDESQHKPPFDQDNYQGYDFDSVVDINLNPDAANKTTWPHRYGFKTPEKHMISMDDGDPKCNRRWKRLEMMSSMGNYLLMKDDPYHPAGEWTNPKCNLSHVYIQPDICVPNYITVVDDNGNNIIIPTAYPCDQGEENCNYTPISVDTPIEAEYQGKEFMCPVPDPMTTISVTTTIPNCLGIFQDKDFAFLFDNSGKNKYHKQKQECFPFLSNRVGLPQSGIYLGSRSPHSLVMDDSVEQPRERTIWERTMENYDMDGCTGVYKGCTYWRSATGHFIKLDDQEINPRIRGPKNGVTIGSACGNLINLNDDTLANCVAGPMRGVHIQSSSGSTFDMGDEGNQQCSPERDGNGKPGSYATKAFIRLRTGGHLEFMMSDANSQQKTDQQYIQLKAPQQDNLQRGPHILHMQQKAVGPGQVFLRAGGDYVVYTYDNMVEVVGEENENPANKMEFISNMKMVNTKDVYYNKAKTHCFYAKEHMFLLAGEDCGENSPCAYPVVLASRPIPEFITAMTGLVASNRIFASGAPTPNNPCEGIASDS